MRAPTLLVFLLLLLAGGLTYWLSTGHHPAALPRSTAPAPKAQTPRPEAVPADTDRTTVVIPDSAGGREAKDQSSGSRPHAPDATWVDVLVVNRAGEPVPGAMVYWFDNGAAELLQANKLLTGAQRSILYREPCRLSERYGWSVQADAEGRARVTASDPTNISGKSDGLFGRLTITPTTAMPADGHRLVLLADDTVRVLVLDESDSPCPGVPITIMAVDPDGECVGEFGHYAMAITEDDGIAELSHVQHWQRLLQSNAELEAIQVRTFVHMLLPHIDDPGTPIDLQAVPTEPIVIHLQGCGSVKMRIDIPGIHAGHELVITSAGKSRYDGHLAGLPSDDGWAHFRNVPILKRYHAHSLASSNIIQEFDGPAFPGDTVEVIIRAPTDSILVRACILDHNREPVATQHMRATFVSQDWPTIRHFTTDERGGALISLPIRDNGSLEIESGELSMLLPNTGFGTGHIGPRILQAGIIDLGEIVLERGLLVAGGQLRDGTEPYTKEIFVSLQTFVPDAAENTPSWRAMHQHVGAVDENGHFKVYANLPGGDHRLHFHGEHNQPVEPVPFRVGDRNLVVQVPVGHSLGASFLLPESIDPEAVQCRLLPTAAPPTTGLPTTENTGTQPQQYEAYPSRGQAERCTLEWRGLPAGSYTLELALWAQPEPLVRVTDIQLPSANNADARLTDIDLRKLVQIVTVDLRKPDGTAADGYGALFSPDQMAEGKWNGHPVFGSATRLLLPPGPVDLQVLLEGHQPAPVRGDGPRIAVRVYPWPTIEVQLAAPVELPENFNLSMLLEAVEPIVGVWHGPNQEDRLKPLLGVGAHDWDVDGDKITLQIADGAHRLRLFVGRGNRKVEVLGTTPTQILPTERNVTVRVPKASLQTAIAAFSK